MSDIFDFTQEGALEATAQQESGFVGFNPKPASKDKNYVAEIRILPFMTNPKQSIVSTVYHWLTDAQGGFKLFSPAIPGAKCEVSNRYFAMKDAKDARLGGLGIQKDYRCLIQIKNDLVHPENNGKIMPYRLPVKVFQMIDGAMNLSEEAIKLNKKPKDMLNPFAGHDITLTVKKTDDGRNYDATEINTELTSMLIDGQQIARTPETEAKVIELLKAAATDFDIVKDYGYTQPDDALMQRAKAVMIEQFGSPTTIWAHVQYVGNGVQAQPVQQQAPSMPASPASPASPAAEQAQQAQPAQSAPVIEQSAPVIEQAQQAPVDDVDAIVSAAIGNAGQS